QRDISTGRKSGTRDCESEQEHGQRDRLQGVGSQSTPPSENVLIALACVITRREQRVSSGKRTLLV
ncbi:MAG: hypothetical protein NTY38_29320, partial [Acidobacteria bacterium]|nr:hypothetical protein [Acidobacteriota bacterium]